MTEVRPTTLDGVVEIQPARFGDTRGYFTETFNVRAMEAAGLETVFVQDNESLSAAVGTVRGIHYQLPPHPQVKLVRVLQGAILDVAVDLRATSPTFGRHVAVELRADLGNQLYVPIGFGHAFCTLAADTIVAYKVSGFYAPDCDRGVRWNDAQIDIDWPVTEANATVSDKDKVAPLLADAADLFT